MCCLHFAASLLFLVCVPVFGTETNSPFERSHPWTSEVQDPDWQVVKDAPSRKWNSADGKFSVTGSLVEFSETKVKISTTDGRNVQVDLSKLSREDNAYVKGEREKMASSNPSGEPDPFEDADEAAPGEIGVVDIRIAEPISLDTDVRSPIDPSVWAIQPPKVKSIVAKAGSLHVRNTSFAVSADNSMVGVTLTDPFGRSFNLREGSQSELREQFRDQFRDHDAEDPSGRPNHVTWVELFLTSNGKLKERYLLPRENCVLEAIDSDAQRLLTVDKAFGGGTPKLQVWKMDGKKLILQRSWQMSPWRALPTSDSIDAWFIDRNHVAIQDEQQLLVIRLNPVEAIYSVDTTKASVVRGSDPKFIQVHTEKDSYEVDLLAGKSFIASSGSETGPFKPSHGKTLSASNRTISVYDASGEVIDEFGVPSVIPNPEFRWLDEDTVVAKCFTMEHFIDVPKGVLLATVAGHHTPPRSSLWDVSSDRAMGPGEGSSFLITFMGAKKNLKDQPNLTEIRRRAFKGGKPPLELFKQGDVIALEVKLTANPHLNELATERLTELLEDRGVVIGSKADAQYVLSASDAAENVEEEYRVHGIRGGTEKVTSRLVGQSVRLLKGGQVVWSAGSSQQLSMMVMTKQNESVQQAVDRNKGNEEDFWNTLQLSGRIVEHPNGRSWYSGIRTPDGTLHGN